MIAILPIAVFLLGLFVAPQLWVPGLVGLPVDFLVYPVWLFILTARGRVREIIRFRHQDWFFLAMLGWIVLSMIANDTNGRTTDILINYTKWFLLYRFISATIQSASTLRQAGWVMVILASIVGVEAIQHMLDPDGLGWAGQRLGWVDPSAASAGVHSRTQWVGIFDGPGVFCVMFTSALPFVLQLLAGSQKKTTRLVAGAVLLPLICWAIFSTGSRGGFLTALAVMGLWALSRFRVSAGKIALAGFIGFSGMMLAPSYLTSTRDENKSAQYRVAMWVEGVEMAQQNPAFGIGKGNFLIYTRKLLAHNSAIEIMGETGIVGLFLWFGLGYMGLKQLIRRHAEAQRPQERELLLAVGLCLIGYFVSSLFVTLEYETLYFILGLTASVRNWTTVPVRCMRRDLRNIAMLTVGYFLFVKIFVMLY